MGGNPKDFFALDNNLIDKIFKKVTNFLVLYVIISRIVAIVHSIQVERRFCMSIFRKKITDSQLLEQLFGLYRGKMYGVAIAILHNETQAEDAVGDAFEKVIHHLDKCRPVDCDKTKKFLTYIVKNAAIDIYRRNQKEQGNVSYDEQEYLIDIDNPLEEYLQKEINNEKIDTLKYMLPDHYWNVISLKYIENLSVEEIAVKLQLTEENVYSRLRRARKKAQELLEESA